jgi:hypothetical protein
MSSGSVSSSIAGHQPISKETVSVSQSLDADIGGAEEARRLRRGGRGSRPPGGACRRGAGSALTVLAASSQLRERRGKPRSGPGADDHVPVAAGRRVERRGAHARAAGACRAC